MNWVVRHKHLKEYIIFTDNNRDSSFTLNIGEATLFTSIEKALQMSRCHEFWRDMIDVLPVNISLGGK